MIIIDTSVTGSICLGITATWSLNGDMEEIGTTLATTATSMTINNVDIDNDKIIIGDTVAYVESLSDEELSELSKKLEEKEFEMVETTEQRENKVEQKIYKR